MLRITRWFWLILLGICLTGCINTDFTRITTDLEYRPDLSIPVGFAEFSLPDSLQDEVGELPQLYEMYDTISYNANILLSPLEEVEKLVYRLYIQNGFPGYIDMQVFYLDADYQTIGPVLDDQPISVAPPGRTKDYIVVDYNNYTIDKELTNAEILALGEVKFVQVKVRIYDMIDEQLPNLETYRIKVHLGVEVINLVEL